VDRTREFPQNKKCTPAQFEINGRKIFAKGSNWVNPEIFPGIITRERYKELIDLAIMPI
jgi:beta-mannosidase